MIIIFADNFKLIFFNENFVFQFRFHCNLFPRGLINNKPALIQLMAYHQTGNKPLSEPIIA